MKILVLASGDSVLPTRIQPYLPFDVVIAADAGAHQIAGSGIVIDVVVGDFDSISADLLNDLRDSKVAIETYPENKDATDLDLALDAALARGATELVVAGGGGGRLDHLLGNVAIVASPRLPTTTWVLGNTTVYPVHDHRRIATQPDATISVLPVGGDASGVTLSGLKWPLTDAKVSATSSLGVSNVADGRSITVSVKRGVVLVIVNELTE